MLLRLWSAIVVNAATGGFHVQSAYLSRLCHRLSFGYNSIDLSVEGPVSVTVDT